MNDFSTNGYGEMRDQLDRVAPESKCPFCRSDDWILGEMRVVLIPVDADGETLLGQGRAVWPLFCKSCGFVRMHEPELLMEGENAV